MNTDALNIDSFETICRRARPHSGYCHIAHRYICIAFFNSILLLYCWRNSVHSHVMCWCLRRISFVVVGKTVGQNRRNTQANWRALAHLHINTSKQNIWFTRRSWKTSCRYYNISCFLLLLLLAVFDYMLVLHDSVFHVCVCVFESGSTTAVSWPETVKFRNWLSSSLDILFASHQ